MLATLADANNEYRQWSNIEELLAVNAEVTHLVYLALVHAFADPGTQMPDPLKIRRPGEEPPAMSMGQIARRMLGR